MSDELWYLCSRRQWLGANRMLTSHTQQQSIDMIFRVKERQSSLFCACVRGAPLKLVARMISMAKQDKAKRHVLNINTLPSGPSDTILHWAAGIPTTTTFFAQLLIETYPQVSRWACARGCWKVQL